MKCNSDLKILEICYLRLILISHNSKSGIDHSQSSDIGSIERKTSENMNYFVAAYQMTLASSIL